MAVMVGYLSLGFIQNSRVTGAIEQLASERGHTVERMKLNPTIGNLIVWRTIYEYDGKYYVSAVSTRPFSAPEIFEGPSVAAINPESIYPILAADSIQREDIRRFDYFAQGYLFEFEGAIADLRYSAEPHKIQPIWGIKAKPFTPQSHVDYVNFPRPNGRALGTTWNMMVGNFEGETISIIAP